MLLRIDTHKRHLRGLVLDNDNRELTEVVRENTKELDKVEGVVLPIWRTTLDTSLPAEEMEEPVKLVKGRGKQMVFRLQVKARDGQPFWVRALVDTGEQARLIRTGLARDLVKPSTRTIRLPTAHGRC